MGSRTMPQECEHGVVLNWGDFGPEEGGPLPPCPQCEQERAERTPHEATVVAVDALIESGLVPAYEWQQDVASRIANCVLSALNAEGYTIKRERESAPWRLR